MVVLSILGWTISVITALFLGKGAVDKIRGTQEMIGNFAFMKLDKYMVSVGIGELAGCVLFLCPIFSIYGLMLIGCFMSAAIALHLSIMDGVKTYIPLLVGFGALLGYTLRVCC